MRAFITGVTGQDGYYLSKLLLEKGYEVYGLVRRTAQPKDIPEGIHVVNGDVTDPGIINEVVTIEPDEIYNLAAMSFVWESFKIPKTTFDINAIGALNMLEAARLIGCKIYQASTSELYGASPPPQNEKTPFYPRSPYGVSKLAAYWLTVNYREAYSLFAVNGILFNHESPKRGIEFVTQKVADYCAKAKSIAILNSTDLQSVLNATDFLSEKNSKYHASLNKYRLGKLKLGNLDAIRDWGHAKDFVEGMWLMMQQEKPDDYVLATGTAHTIRDLLTCAFSHIGISDWTPYVEIDPKFYRPAEVEALIGDSTKARKIGWKPKYSFEQLVKEMIDAKIASYSS